MDFIKKIFRGNIIVNIALIIFGIVLIIFPLDSISVISKVLACILTITGLANIIYFFIDKNDKAKIDTFYFILSLILIGLGIYTFLNPLWLITTINIFVGVILIMSAINNLVYLFKYTIRNYLWWICTSLSGIILILGVVSLINPLDVASIITRLEGVSLVFDAIMSLLVFKKFTLLLKEPNN